MKGLLNENSTSGHSTSSTRERKKIINNVSDHSVQSFQSTTSRRSFAEELEAIESSDHSDTDNDSYESLRKEHPTTPKGHQIMAMSCWSSTKVLVLVILSLQNSLFTVLRRYSQGVLREDYSKYEVLLVGEIIKMLFSAYMISRQLYDNANAESGGSSSSNTNTNNGTSNTSSPAGSTGITIQPAVMARLHYLLQKSGKMVGLALIYGAMNILSFVSLRNIGAGMFTIFAQCKILTTASFSTLLLQRRYSWVKWRSLVALIFGVLLFSEPIWGNSDNLRSKRLDANLPLGVAAVLIEVTLSGFASIYFEKVVKTDPLQLTIWERNFQLAFGSFPVYLAFIAWSGGGTAGLLGGWSFVAVIVTILGAAGGLLVALSIKYGDAILKTLATTAAIILSSVLDKIFLGGPLTNLMIIAGVQVVIAIMNYTFDPTPADVAPVPPEKELQKGSDRPLLGSRGGAGRGDEEIGLVERKASASTAVTK